MSNNISNRNDLVYAQVKTEETNEKIRQLGEELLEPLPCFGVRHIQVLLGCFAIFLSYGVRASLSVAIVAMTDPSINNDTNIPTYSDWPNSIVLSSFFWGYIIPQAIVGWTVTQYGAKWLLVSFVSVGSCLGFLIPWVAAHFDYIGVCILRAAQGLFFGCIFPSVFYLISQWVPPSERARLGSFAQTGAPLGTVFSLITTGILSASAFGWPMVFYFYSTLGLIWCVAMANYGYNRPAECPYISSAEKIHIQLSLGHACEKKKHKTPWKAILTSAPVWSLLSVQTGSLLTFYLLLTQIPTYMNHVMKFTISNNSLLSAIPYILYWILSILSSCICDHIINKQYISVTGARKIFSSIGVIIPALAMVYLGYTESHEVTQGVILMMIAVALNSTITSGWGVNHIDLAPNHAGTLVGVLGAIANCTGFIGSLLVQCIVIDLSNPAQWRIVFLLVAAFSICTSLIYNFFGSGEIQYWNEEVTYVNHHTNHDTDNIAENAEVRE